MRSTLLALSLLLALAAVPLAAAGQSLDLQAGGVTVTAPDNFQSDLDFSFEARLGAGRQVASPHLLVGYSRHTLDLQAGETSANAFRLGAGIITAAAEFFYVRFGGAMEQLSAEIPDGQGTSTESQWRPAIEMAVGAGTLGEGPGGTVELITRSRLSDTPVTTVGVQVGMRLGGPLE